MKIGQYPSATELGGAFGYESATIVKNGAELHGALRRKGNGLLSFGTPHPKTGHCQIGISGRLYYIHRLIWVLHFGNIPNALVVDHRDNNPRNNRLENLRLATHSQNQMNRSKSRNGSRCPYIGVCEVKERYWVAYGPPEVPGAAPRYLGLFRDPIEAATARDRAAYEAYGAIATLNSTLFGLDLL